MNRYDRPGARADGPVCATCGARGHRFDRFCTRCGLPLDPYPDDRGDDLATSGRAAHTPPAVTAADAARIWGKTLAWAALGFFGADALWHVILGTPLLLALLQHLVYGR